MTDFDALARTLATRAAAIEGGAHALLRAAAQAASAELIAATPKRTGRAAANWLVGAGIPRTEVVATVDAATATARNEAEIAAIEAGEIILSNNVDYIAPLNRGTADRPPAGFVEAAVRVAIAKIRGGTPRS